MIQERKITAYSKTHAMLATEPNDILSADQLKVWWDTAPEEARAAINGIIDDIIADYATKAELSGIQLGQITDGTITEPKLETSLAQKANGGLVDFLSRQAIINGNFDIWQRGTSFTNPSLSGYHADRWKVGTVISDGGTFPTFTLTRQTMGDIYGSYWLKRLNVNGASVNLGANTEYSDDQLIENGTRYLCGAGKKITVSFYARSSIAGKRVGVCAFQAYGTGGSPSILEPLFGNNVALTTNWTKCSVTIPTATLAGKTFGTNNDDYLQIRIYHAWGTSIAARVAASTAEGFSAAGNIDIAQIQVNAGDSALPFQPKSVANETSDSLRYTWIPQGNSVLVRATQISTNTMVFHVPLPVTLRTTPSIRGAVNTDMVVCNISGGAQTGFAATVALTGSGVTLTMTKTSHGLSDAYLEIKPTSGFDAEL